MKPARNAIVFIKKQTKRLLLKSPWAMSLANKLLYIWQERQVLKYGDTRADLFSRYYEDNLWGSEESVSGPGSTLDGTVNIRKELPLLFQKLAIKEVLDAPCGDCNWIMSIDWHSQINYLGCDIVKGIVERNSRLYGGDRNQFYVLDIVSDPLPKGDIWLCRDCFIHLSYKDIRSSLMNFLSSDIPYLLMTNYPNCSANHDIPTGSYRPINFCLPPFNFEQPITSIDDNDCHMHDRQISMWNKSSINNALFNTK